jgi:transcriptional regulator with XRE-family HTH domain
MDKPTSGPTGRAADAVPVSSTAEVGARIRRERERRGMSLRELARRAGLSPSLVSQIETGKSEPSVSSLAAIVGEIGLSLNELVFGEEPQKPAGAAQSEPQVAGPAPPPGLSQAEGARQTIHLDSRVTWERLTAEPDHDVDFLYVTYDVGGASTALGSLMRHQGKEYGFVISGRLGLTVGFAHYELGPGGSISFDSTVPHRLWNAGDEPVRAVWTVVGRRAAADAHAVELD